MAVRLNPASMSFAIRQIDQAGKTSEIEEACLGMIDQWTELKNAGIAVDPLAESRLKGIAAQNALAEEKRKQSIAALNDIRSQCSNGQHQVEINDGGVVGAVPDFQDIVSQTIAGRLGGATDEEIIARIEAQHPQCMAVKGALNVAMGVMDEDEELQVVVGKEDLKSELTCPISQTIMKVPFESTKCKHCFDKDMILGMLRRRQYIQCPVAGCSASLTTHDLQESRKLAAKLKKYEKNLQRKVQYGADLPDEPEDAATFTLVE